jgi:hypothetical protein
MMPYKTAGECAQEYENRLIERHTAPLCAELAAALTDAEEWKQCSRDWRIRAESAESERDKTRARAAEPAPSLVEQIEAIVKRTEEVIAERSESPAETGHRQSVGYGRIRDLLRAAREAGGR